VSQGITSTTQEVLLKRRASRPRDPLAAALVDAVLEGLPDDQLAGKCSNARRALEAAAATLGPDWTPEVLRQAVAGEGWSWARTAGAVVDWLKRRPAKPPPPTKHAARGRCIAPDCVDGWLGEDEQGRPRPCPTCRPNAGRRSA
jgi:hypothetical protein